MPNLTDNGHTSLPASLAQCTELEELNLHGNQLETLPNLATLKKLRILVVGYNRFETLPDWIGELAELERLPVSDNPLRTLPASFGQLSKLVSMDVTCTELEVRPGGAASTHEAREEHDELASTVHAEGEAQGRRRAADAQAATASTITSRQAIAKSALEAGQ